MATRKIIDIEQNGEKVWPKGHAKATFMSDGRTVEDAINSIKVPSLDEYVTETELNNKGFLTEHQDLSEYAKKDELPSVEGLASQSWVSTEIAKAQLEGEDVDLSGYATKEDIANFATKNELPSVDGLASTAYVDEAVAAIEIPSVEGFATEAWVNEQGFLTEHQDITGKQDAISDLETIRDGASKGATALQSSDIDAELNIESSNPIQNKVVTETLNTIIDDTVQLVGGLLDTFDNYQPIISDLATIRSGAEKGATALQSVPEGYATETWVGEQGFLTEHQDISHLANKDDIPSLDGYAKTSDIPSLDGYAKTEDIPSLEEYATKQWVNNKNYATEDDLNNIEYSSINNVPVSEDETGELNITDESGNIGMKVASKAVYAKDFVAGEHKLSEKVDKTYVDNSIAEAPTVKYVAQSLTSDQKLQARSNIGASDGSKSVVSLSGTRILINKMEPYVVYAAEGVYNSVTINGVVTNSIGIQLRYAEYTLVFQTGTNCTLQLPNTIYWANGVIPSIEDNTKYELSISFSKCAGADTYRAVLIPFKRVS